MKRRIFLLLAITFFLSGAFVYAQTPTPDSKGNVFLPLGFIQNGIGQKCWYIQTYYETYPLFMPASMQNTTHHDLRFIVFSNPTCMSNNLGGLGRASMSMNKSMIHKKITSWFLGNGVLKDANFETDTTYAPGKYQSRGNAYSQRHIHQKGSLYNT